MPDSASLFSMRPGEACLTGGFAVVEWLWVASLVGRWIAGGQHELLSRSAEHRHGPGSSSVLDVPGGMDLQGPPTCPPPPPPPPVYCKARKVGRILSEKKRIKSNRSKLPSAILSERTPTVASATHSFQQSTAPSAQPWSLARSHRGVWRCCAISRIASRARRPPDLAIHGQG